jgi:hypothetical protein
MPHPGNPPLGPGDEVELVGLKATALNGRRGRVAAVRGAETPKEGRVAVLLDGSAKAKSVRLVNLKAVPSTLAKDSVAPATPGPESSAGSVEAKPKPKSTKTPKTPGTCDGCGKPGAPSKCAGCLRVAYCSKSCQVQHWKKGGHKRECKQLKVAATPTDQPPIPVEADIPGGSGPCFICLDGDDEPRPIPLGCACRGNAGFAHPTCVEAATMADGIDSGRWTKYMTCKQEFTGALQLGLARRRWTRVRDKLETNIPLASKWP